MKTVLILITCYVACIVAEDITPTQGKHRPSECSGGRPKVKPEECCTGAVIVPDSDLDDCKEEFPNSDSDNRRHGRMGGNTCVMDCYFNKTGIFSAGKPVKAIALDILGRSTDAAMTALLNDGIDKCIEFQAGMKTRRRQNMSTPPGGPPPPPQEMQKNQCRPDAKLFLHCVQLFLYAKCPEDNLVLTDECVELKAFTQKCMPPISTK